MSVYEGTENYIFVSYAHKDSDVVIPIVETLQQNGFRLWYDSAIEVGTEWPEYIETHLENSDKVVVFMSDDTVESRNCRNEINFALDARKEILVIYLEEVELRYGLKLQLGSTQSMFKNRHDSEESFLQTLCSAKLLQSCKGSAVSNEASTDAVAKVQKTVQPKIMISNICTIGTNDDSYWPQGHYSDIIDRDEYKVVCVHIFLLQEPGNVTVNESFRIFDEQGNVVRETVGETTFEEDHDRVSFRWHIRKDDGSYFKVGKYRVEASFGSGNTYVYDFTVTAGGENRTQTAEPNPLDTKSQTKTVNTPYGAMISNICTIGTNDDDDLWPIGRYSNTINRDKTRILRFRIQLLKPVGYNGSAIIDKKIYDANGNLVVDEITHLDVLKNYDRFSLCWILKNEDGSFVASGKYRAEIAINGGKVFTYTFTVTSDSDLPPFHGTENAQTDERAKAIADLEKKIARPQGIPLTVLSAVGYFIALLCVAMETDIIIMIGVLVAILCTVPICIYTKKYVWNSVLGAFALTYLFGFYYGIYTIVIGIIAISHMGEWKQELARLRENS